MSIFDAFSFKKEAGKVFTKENFASILKKTKEQIVEKAKLNIPGQEKKILVDDAVIANIHELAAPCKNKWVLWIIDRIIEITPTVTQLVYDFLKEKIENL